MRIQRTYAHGAVSMGSATAWQRNLFLETFAKSSRILAPRVRATHFKRGHNRYYYIQRCSLAFRASATLQRSGRDRDQKLGYFSRHDRIWPPCARALQFKCATSLKKYYKHCALAFGAERHHLGHENKRGPKCLVALTIWGAAPLPVLRLLSNLCRSA